MEDRTRTMRGRAEVRDEMEKELQRRALTLAVVCVEQRVDALRAEWRGMSDRQQAKAPGLEDQFAAEKEALRWLKQRRDEAYR